MEVKEEGSARFSGLLARAFRQLEGGMDESLPRSPAEGGSKCLPTLSTTI